MLRLAHLGTRALPLFVVAVSGCTEARIADAGPMGSTQNDASIRDRDGDTGDRDASTRNRDAGREPRDAGAAGSATSAGSGASRNLDGGCAPQPCPFMSAWSSSGCGCVVVEPAGHDPECTVDSDCVLTPRGCCFPCAPLTADSYLAVPRAKQAEVAKGQCPNGPVACSPCARVAHDPLAPILHSECVNRRCAVVDLRRLPLSSCVQDSDCAPVGYGCCGAYSEDPEQYVGVVQDAGLEILQCVPAPPCQPPEPHGDPLSFCAEDSHCAVRRRERVSSVESATCFSPTQNLDHAYDPAAVGCDCKPPLSVCKQDSTGRQVALVCDEARHWDAVEDGPCGV